MFLRKQAMRWASQLPTPLFLSLCHYQSWGVKGGGELTSWSVSGETFSEYSQTGKIFLFLHTKGAVYVGRGSGVSPITSLANAWWNNTRLVTCPQLLPLPNQWVSGPGQDYNNTECGAMQLLWEAMLTLIAGTSKAPLHYIPTCVVKGWKSTPHLK